jgi:DNA uptake protein ComE-like DNA-binding protein
MASSLTSKGKGWEYRNSLWMLWTLITMGMLNYVSFFYISRKVNQKKWFKAGLVYLAIFIIFMSIPDSFTPVFIISWFVSIFHVFKIRAEYLLRLEAIQSSGLENRELNKLKENIAREYNKPKADYNTPETRIDERAPIKSQVPPIKTENHIYETKGYVQEQVDINTATEKEIANVPGIGSIFAAKVVAVRDQDNGFQSFDHFVQALSVKPHLAEKMKPYIFFSNKSYNEQHLKKPEGRIVDF